MIPIRAGRWWHLVGLLSLTSGMAFLASLAAVLFLTFSQPPFHAPTTDPDPASAVPPNPAALTLTVPVAHGRTGETSALMERAARHRSWTIRPSGGGNRRTLELPTEDLLRLNSVHTGPEHLLGRLAEEPPPPPGAPRTTVQLDWELQHAPAAGVAAAALTPAFLITLALGALYMAGLAQPLLRRQGRRETPA